MMAGEDAEEEYSDVDTSDEGDGEGAGLMRPDLDRAREDYFGRLAPEATDHHVLGVLYEVRDIMGELWERGLTELVGALAHFFGGQNEEVDNKVLTTLRRLTMHYRLHGDHHYLPRYWQHWAEFAMTRLRALAACRLLRLKEGRVRGR